MSSQVSPAATTCHQVQSWMVFGSAGVSGSTENCDHTPLARKRMPTAAAWDHLMLIECANEGRMFNKRSHGGTFGEPASFRFGVFILGRQLCSPFASRWTRRSSA